MAPGLATTSTLSRVVAGVALALGLGLAFTPGCGSSQDRTYGSSRHRAIDLPEVPESTVARLTECGNAGASRLTDTTYAIQFDVESSRSGEVRSVRVRDSAPHDGSLESCMMSALSGMSVPRSALARRPSGALSPESRGYMGDATTLLLGGAINLGPVFIVIAGVTIIVAVAVYVLSDSTTATQDATDESESERCRKVFDMCSTKCMATLPTGQFGGDKYHKCLRECMEANNCWGTKRY